MSNKDSAKGLWMNMTTPMNAVREWILIVSPQNLELNYEIMKGGLL